MSIWTYVEETDLADISPESALRKRAERLYHEQRTGLWAPYVVAAIRANEEGELEFSQESHTVSLSCDEGAYVLMWQWIADESAGQEVWGTVSAAEEIVEPVSGHRIPAGTVGNVYRRAIRPARARRKLVVVWADCAVTTHPLAELGTTLVIVTGCHGKEDG